MRAVRFVLSGELIRQALAIPDGANILHIMNSSAITKSFVFVVEHPDLPEVLEGADYPEVSPQVDADYEKRPGTWLTFKWGLKDE